MACAVASRRTQTQAGLKCLLLGPCGHHQSTGTSRGPWGSQVPPEAARKAPGLCPSTTCRRLGSFYHSPQGQGPEAVPTLTDSHNLDTKPSGPWRCSGAGAHLPGSRADGQANPASPQASLGRPAAPAPPTCTKGLARLPQLSVPTLRRTARRIHLGTVSSPSSSRGDGPPVPQPRTTHKPFHIRLQQQ